MKHKKIGVVIADNYEFLPFLESAEKFGVKKSELFSFETAEFNVEDKEIVAIKCRIGKVNAANATSILISNKTPDCILNIGLSGGVKNVRRNDVVLGTAFTECDFDLTAIGYPLGEKPEQEFVYEADNELLSYVPTDIGIVKGKLGTGDFFITKDEMKQDFYDRFGISAFDMETGAIASVCHDFDIPFMSLRKISDDSEDSAADDYRQMNELCETALSDILIDIIQAL